MRNLTFLVLVLSAHVGLSQSQELINGLTTLVTKFQSGEYGEMLSLAERTAMLSEKELGPRDGDHALVLFILGAAQAEMGLWKESEQTLLKSEDILKNPVNYQVHQAPYLGYVYMGFGRLYTAKGQLKKAEEMLLKSAKTLEALGGKNENYALPINDLGNFYKETGDYGKAEKYLFEASEIRRRRLGEKHFNYGVSLNNLGSLYEQMGNYQAAAMYYEDAFNIWKKSLGEFHPLVATAYNNYAGLQTKVGLYHQAIDFYKYALVVCAKVYGENHEKYATTLSNLANAYSLQGDVAAARTHALRAMEIRKKLFGERHLDFASSQNNLGLIALNAGDYQEATNLLSQALATFKKMLGPKHRSISVTTMNLAIAHARSNNEKAFSFLKESLSVSLDRIDNVFPTMSDREKMLFYQTVQNDFEFFNYLATRHIAKDKALAGDIITYSMATKALLLNASTKTRREILSSNNPALIQLYERWREQKNELALVWQMSEADKARNGINEALLEKEIAELEKKLSAQSTRFASQATNKRYTWRDAQKVLKPDEALVEIVRFRTFLKDFTDTVQYAAVVVKGGTAQPTLVHFKNGNELEGRALKFYKNGIKKKFEDKESREKYWAPIAAELQGVKRAFVCPDGIYNVISLNSLFNASTGKYVIDEIDLRQITNAKDLLALPRAGTVRNVVLLGFPDYQSVPTHLQRTDIEESPALQDSTRRQLADIIAPLPGTLKEVNDVKKVFDEKKIKADLVTGLAADESFLKQVRSPSILHIATHGFFLADIERRTGEGRTAMGVNTERAVANPLLRSGILLAGAQKAVEGAASQNVEDGIMTAFEASNLALENTDLVVLSACETGLGEIRNGEGVYGFQRALIMAGARTVIMSLWTVDDEATQLLMTRFYQLWIGGLAKREAFAKALAEIKSKYPHPYFWAPFIMVGE